ncbi:MAG: cell division protein FtsZ [Proteobacteria bacterium]|nr:cell division protein FtsZ [Pseudomonadota bacterium]
MTLNLQLPKKNFLKPTITVFGVGGAGGNAVNNMISAKLEGVNFVVANTDAQSLENSLCEKRIQLGENITQGLGAGSYPEVGKAAAEEATNEIQDHLQGSNMVFITAGMGGGTGTGAGPVVARLAREQGILTVAVITKPFQFEGTPRMRIAEQGIAELQKYVDTLIVIPNQNLFRVVDKNTTFKDAFKLADNVLRSGVQGVTDLIVMPGLINLDFADIRSVMGEMGKAMMGTGEAKGDKRAIEAAEAAISNPLLDNVSMKGARGVLINITGGPDLTLFEVDEAANRVREEVDPEANIIFGSAFDESLEGIIRVSVVATGIDNVSDDNARLYASATRSSERNEVRISAKIEEDDADNEYFNRASTTASRRPSASQYYEPESSKAKFALDESDDDAFIAPEPLAPSAPPVFSSRQDTNAAISAASAAAPSRTVDAPRVSAQQTYKPQATASAPVAEAKKTMGLFGLGGKKRVEAVQESTQKALEKVISGATVRESGMRSKEEALPKEDLLDIPAFLRRKTN